MLKVAISPVSTEGAKLALETELPGWDFEAVQNAAVELWEKELSRIKATIKDYGVDEKYFLETLDEMTEMAFDDQCTGANPRYPLMSEIKQMYLNAYYGE